MLRDRRGGFIENLSVPVRCFATANTIPGSFAVLWFALSFSQKPEQKEREKAGKVRRRPRSGLHDLQLLKRGGWDGGGEYGERGKLRKNTHANG